MFKFISRIVLTVLIVLFAVLLFFNGFYTINEQQQGVIETFGAPSHTVGPGPHFKIPFVQKLKKVSTVIHGMPVGYIEETGQTVPSEATMITKDFNFINADFYIEWRVSDPIKFLYNSNDPEGVLKNIGQQCIRSVVGRTDVDPIMTTGKGEAQSLIKEMLTQELDAADIGVYVSNVTVQDVDPPTDDVVQAFKRVEDAKQHMDTDLNNANTYKNEKIPAARAEADSLIQQAEGAKSSRINEATGQVARFNEMFAEYIKNPDVTKLRLFYESMEKILPDLEVIITDGNSQVIVPTKPLVEATETSKTGGTQP